MNNTKKYFEYSKINIKSFFETIIINCSRKKDIGGLSIFFIFSLGRTGTQFFSKLLNNDPEALVFHEPMKRDALEYVKSFKNNYDYDSYIDNFKMRSIQSIIQRRNSSKRVNIYGECNSYLRRHSPAIMSLVPNVKGLYVIRDGRNVVRSMMSRSAMSDTWYYSQIKPKHSDPYFNKWRNWGRFEKCCWLWASENDILYQQFGAAIQFELLLTDYNYFKSNMLDVLNLVISESLWEKERQVKSDNKTRQFKCPPYEDWRPSWKDSFWEICGKVMDKNGYR